MDIFERSSWVADHVRLFTRWTTSLGGLVPDDALERHRKQDLCIASVPVPGGSRFRLCPEPALDGSWCEQHTDLFGGTEDDDIPDPYLDDSELGSGISRVDGARDERYGYRGDRWSG